ncbi:aldolase catalytic domain-containing protein [Vreelandella sedimenti]|uniref:aldolase catalytic domain-containing protein n=1 Tax=Vreelandella sedimenti TaxID=2729618 RepID=UPI0025803A73|nr:aldolase catalytic domain-containing protein [Halomonas sp. UBA3173]|tara:strand:- start:19760 stop:20785 length:1026 start_codon:yes stop_codon:yes gene_type:complete
MNQIKIVDVTLRDGGYRNNFNFTTEYAQKAIAQLAKTGVQYCEIGYRNGSFKRKQEHGLTSSVAADYISALRDAAAERIGLCVMVHPHNVDASDFEVLREQGVSLIRVCLHRNHTDEGLSTIALAKSFGFEVSANITHITTLNPSDISNMCLRAEAAGADLLVFADSNGNMIPTDVYQLISRISNRVLIPLGFHAHNNLSLALSNSISAIEAGAKYIDTSICGMGKGAGNLHLSMLIAYLHRVGIDNDYDMISALQLSQLTAESVPSSSLPAPLLDVMMGSYNLSFDIQQKIDEFMLENEMPSIFHALQAIHDQCNRKQNKVPKSAFQVAPISPAAQRGLS